MDGTEYPTPPPPTKTSRPEPLVVEEIKESDGETDSGEDSEPELEVIDSRTLNAQEEQDGTPRPQAGQPTQTVNKITKAVYIVTKKQKDPYLDPATSIYGVYDTVAEANEAARECVQDGDLEGVEPNEYSEDFDYDDRIHITADFDDLEGLSVEVAVEESIHTTTPVMVSEPQVDHISYAYVVRKITQISVDTLYAAPEVVGYYKSQEGANAVARQIYDAAVLKTKEDGTCSQYEHSMTMDGSFYGSVLNDRSKEEEFYIKFEVVKHQLL